MKEIPNECINAILINFAKDSKNLFSCCLVNRLWCLNAIPILWSNPLQREVSKSLIRTYISTLSPEEKEPLISFGITLPNLPKPLFDYGVFLKVLDTSSTKNGIELWLKDEGLNNNCDNDEEMLISVTAYNVIMDSLITMFLRKSENLEELLINDQHMIPTVTTFLNAMPGITKLKTLRVKFWNYRIFTNSNIMELINALTPQVCPHLKQLDIKSYLPSDVSDALVNIIKSHKKLEKIELDTYITTRSTKSVVVYNISDRASEKNVKDFFLFCGHISELKIIMNENENKQIAFITFKRETAAETALMLTNAIIADSQIIVKPLDDINHIYSKIFPVLNYVGDSLKELTLRYMDFSKISPDNIGNISKCQNLIRLKCINCKKMTSAHCTSLSKNQLNLKTLEITDSSLDQNIIIFLISMWGSTLEVLHLDKLSQETANALLIHCLNLKELVIYNLLADSLKFMLPFLQQSSLKSLLINAFSKSYLKYFDLGPYLPNTLTFLGLYTDFNNDDFETFVKYCGKFVDLKTLNIKRLNI